MHMSTVGNLRNNNEDLSSINKAKPNSSAFLAHNTQASWKKDALCILNVDMAF